MRRLDMYWRTQHEWWYLNENGQSCIRDDAPEDVKKSYEHYLEQINQPVKVDY